MTRIDRLICLPYAGGSSLAFRSWHRIFTECTIRAPELPGRGRRAGEPLMESMDALVSDLVERLADDLYAPGDYALFGHSFGGLLAFALTARLERAGMPLPRAVCISGINPPHRLRAAQLHRLDDARFAARVAEYGGLPREIQQRSVWLRDLLPVLRADFRAMETHAWSRSAAINVPIDIVEAREDPAIDARSLHEWSRYSTRGARLHGIDARGHFYLDTHGGEIAALIAAR